LQGQQLCLVKAPDGVLDVVVRTDINLILRG
jgi:hypothetical protein